MNLLSAEPYRLYETGRLYGQMDGQTDVGVTQYRLLASSSRPNKMTSIPDELGYVNENKRVNVNVGPHSRFSSFR